MNGDYSGLANGVYLDVVNGAINARNAAGELDYSAGQFGFVGARNIAPILLPNDPGLPPQDTGSGGQSFGEGQTGGAGCFVH